MAQTPPRVAANDLAPGDVCQWAWPKRSFTAVKVVAVIGERVAVIHKQGRATVFASSLRGPVTKAAPSKAVKGKKAAA